MTSLLQYDFFRNALIGIIFIAVSSAVIGTYVVARRLVSISGGITHACFGGLGLGYYLGINPVITAIIFAVGSALGVEWMARTRNVREDSAIAAVWGAGMALGVLFVFLTPGYVPELNSFLFGNILTVTVTDIITYAVYTAILLGLLAVAYRPIVAVAFDRDFAAVRGLPVTLINTVMTVMTAVCIVLTIRMVGIMLLMSMLSLPQIMAEIYCRRFVTIMLLSTAISVTCCVAGLFLATVIDVPCSALIVLVMIAALVVCKTVEAVRK
ncbi:MAG: metal ABC transporter permease [Bacteroidales bacterium]|nr:metal ABC transporter permease [Bacteroidales bacterium]MBD5253640.1 metal ABC transporter permease [Barnesiella sp.]MBD5344316.1 metal ABC transporter permease [Bacteroides sp.]